MCNDDAEDVCGDVVIVCLRMTRLCIMCIAVASVFIAPALAFDRVHKTLWPHWHSIASWSDSVRALISRREVSRAELVQNARLELWRTAARRTQLRCWDFRPPCAPSLYNNKKLGCAGEWRQRNGSPNASVLLRPADLVPSDLSLSVVGNGLASSNASAELIDSSDAVVRFNDFVLSPSTTGSRTDVHAMNGNIHGDRACRAPINVILECQYRVETPPEACRSRRTLVCVPTPSTFGHLCHGVQAGADASRGFLVMSVFRRDPSRVKLFGFRGRGHWYDSARSAADRPNVRVRDPRRWRPAHHLEVEHGLLHGVLAKQVASLVA